MSHSQISKLATICAISTTVPSSFALTVALDAASTLGMFTRDLTSSNTCGGDANLSPCGGALPSDFCCASGATCLPLNNNTATICCPHGQTCNVIEPINCDITQQNATLHPDSSLHSNDLTSQLPSCGSNQCCPLGYNCQDNSCWMDKENANPSSASAAPPAASYTASVAHPSGTSSSSDTSSAPARSGISPGGAAAAAFFPALLLGIALAFLGLWLYRKRRDKVARQPKELRYSDTLSQTARNVSDPIYDPRYGNRTDFLSSARSASDYGAEMSGANPYAPGTGGSQPISGAQSDFSFSPSPPPKTPGTSTSDRVRSIFGRDRLGSSPYYARSPLSPPSAHTRDERAPPPAPIMTQRHTSSETIDVLMPPQASYGNGLDSRGSEPESGSAYGLAPPPRRPGDARNTTFTSMMEQAGFKRSDLTGRESESEPSSGGSGPTSARAPGANERRGYI